MLRVIRDLHYAKVIDRPSGIPIGRPRGVKKEGYTFEAEFVDALRRSLGERSGMHVTHGQWFQYHDARGAGVCQTDVLLETPGCVIVFECKRTWVEEAQMKLDVLYLPVVSRALGKPAVGVVVCKNLRRGLCQPIYADLLGAISGAPSVLHWSGFGIFSLVSGAALVEKLAARTNRVQSSGELPQPRSQMEVIQL